MLKTIDELIEEMYNSEPASSYSQLEDFEKTTVYRDLQMVYSIWIDEFRNIHELGEGQESSDYYRGAINTLKKVKEATDYLKDVIEKEDFSGEE